jgi:hypothetical protein
LDLGYVADDLVQRGILTDDENASSEETSREQDEKPEQVVTVVREKKDSHPNN